MMRKRQTPAPTDEPKGKLSKEEAQAAFASVDLKTLTPPSKTIAEINAANRETWAEWNQKFATQAKKCPHDVALAVKMEADLVKRIVLVFGEAARDKAVKVSAGIMPMVFAFAESFAKKQAANANHPRDRQSIHMKETIKAMHRARADGQAFKDFLRAADAGDIEGLLIHHEPNRGPHAYVVVLDDVSRYEAQIGTLSDWFTKAANLDSDVAG